MSINTLLDNPDSQSKPWANLYVDTLTAYKSFTAPHLDVKDVSVNGNEGTPGQIIRKSPSGIEWANLPGAKIDPGLPGQFLRTDEVTGEVDWEDFSLSVVPTGAPNQVLTTSATGNSIEWADPPSGGLTPGIENQILKTGSSGTLEWSHIIDPNMVTIRDELNVSGDIKLNSHSGVVGQYIKKTGNTAQAWSRIVASDITPGTNNQILSTNSAGTGSVWSSTLNVTSVTTTNANIIGNLVLSSVSGSPGQYIRKSTSSTQTWSKIQSGDITGGSLNQVLVTGENGPIWSPFLNVETISINGGSNLNYYKHLPDITTTWQRSVDSSDVTPLTIKMSRIGRVVTVSLTGIDVAVPEPESKLRSADFLPAEIRPNLPFDQTIVGYDWPSLEPVNLIVSVGGNGSISIKDYSETGNWSGKTFLKINLTWHLD